MSCISCLQVVSFCSLHSSGLLALIVRTAPIGFPVSINAGSIHDPDTSSNKQLLLATSEICTWPTGCKLVSRSRLIQGRQATHTCRTNWPVFPSLRLVSFCMWSTKLWSTGDCCLDIDQCGSIHDPKTSNKNLATISCSQGRTFRMWSTRL